MSPAVQHVPRFMIAGTGSGCGKTTVTCAILQALKDRGLNIGAFKCGPDYIDPMFHSRILGKPCGNLDSFFFNENTLKYLLCKNGAGNDVNLIEGVMGFYDGLGISSTEASSYDISRISRTPVILVIDAKGSALSALAVLQGFMTFRPGNLIRGVIFNNCTEMAYQALAKAIRGKFKDQVQPLGFMPKLQECSLESRHLGLVTAQEVDDLPEKVQRLAGQAKRSVDLDSLLAIAEEAEDLCCEPVLFPHFPKPVRIAAAMDKAFCFYYSDNLSVLREMGAEIIPFSPVEDKRLPENIQGLYLGGGYPELYAGQLSANDSMLKSVLTALEEGLPCIAECGGFMYLSSSIAGDPMDKYHEGDCYNTEKLTRFGYIQLKVMKNSMIADEGEEIPAHEFHYWDSTSTGEDFTAAKRSGKSWKCAFSSDHLYAGFPHFHFYSKPEAAIRFYETCLRYLEAKHD